MELQKNKIEKNPIENIGSKVEQIVAEEILKVKGSIEDVIYLLDIVSGQKINQKYLRIGPYEDKQNLLKIVRILLDFDDRLNGDFRITRKKGKGYYISIELVKNSSFPILDKENDNNFTTRTLEILDQTFNIEITDELKISCISNQTGKALKVFNPKKSKYNSKQEVFEDFMEKLKSGFFDSQLEKILNI